MTKSVENTEVLDIKNIIVFGFLLVKTWSKQ